MPESLKVAMMLAGICSLICMVGACLFFTAAKRNDCGSFGTLDSPVTEEL